MIAPDSAPALFDAAEHLLALGDYRAAASHYYRYLELRPGHTYARERLAQAYISAGDADATIQVIEQLRVDPYLRSTDLPYLTAGLAHAFLLKGDWQQAMELVTTQLGRKRVLDPGEQNCLRERAISRYLAGQPGKALQDLDRLYALNPAYPELQTLRDEIRSGHFKLELPPGRDVFHKECQNCGAPSGGLLETACRYCGNPFESLGAAAA